MGDDSQTVDEDGSVTILLDDNEVMAVESNAMSNSRKTQFIMRSPALRSQRHDRSVTFEDIRILCSSSKQPSSFARRRRETLDSERSVSIDYEDRNGNLDFAEHKHSPSNVKDASQGSIRNVHNLQFDYSQLPCPSRNEYFTKYRDSVNRIISNFSTEYPGKFRDYRTLSAEEKESEQHRVQALLNRLGILKGGVAFSQRVEHQQASPLPTMTTKPKINDKETILDDSPFAPSSGKGTKSQKPPELQDHLSGQDNREEHHSAEKLVDTSELLLSRDSDKDAMNINSNAREPPFDPHQEETEVSTEFLINDDHGSDSSMEIVRRAPSEVYNHDTNDDASHETPEALIIQQACTKRQASTSGKRGSDTQRMRTNEDHDDCMMDISYRLGRLSVSPLARSPMEKLFAASLSPISPNLPPCPASQASDRDVSLPFEGDKIDWGQDSVGRRIVDRSVESIATDTPSNRFKNKSDRHRSLREVPVNVSMKDGMRFHLNKLSVKRSEHNREKSSRPTTIHDAAKSYRRPVNFPDPISRYSRRTRKSLTEIYSCIRAAEKDFQKAHHTLPVAAIFFSLSEQQIQDVSLKLFLKDSADSAMQKSLSDPPTVLKGGSLVVARSKEDTNVWESALREQTGCSVCNHSKLPLSERIRSSSAEKACEYDVVLTTYDAMKSPDITIPVSKDGHALLKSERETTGWHSCRIPSQLGSVSQPTKQLSILHRIRFKRILFVDTIGRKCYLVKGGTTRASAAVALTGDTRIAFFQESDTAGSSPLQTLRKSDKRAYESVAAALHLPNEGRTSDSEDELDEKSVGRHPIESIAIDFNDLC